MGCAPSTGKASSVAPGKYDESVAVSVTAKTNGAAGGAGGAGGGGGGASDAADDAANATCDLFIIHFNDVYNINARPKAPAGGAARFTRYVKHARSDGDVGRRPLVLFSGDAFFPSLLSTVTRGKQMPEVLNAIGCHASVLGNHDLDMGLETCEELIGMTNFPWLLGNCIDKRTGKQLAGLQPTLMVEWQGRKVGLMGLIEHEWIATLGTITPEQVDYTDFVAAGQRLADELRRDGAELVVALTHMRVPNDERLAKEVPDIDIICGGHDHHYEVRQIGQVWLVKSGTDFREGTEIRIKLRTGSRPSIATKRFEIIEDLAEDPDIRDLVLEYDKVLGGKMDQVIGETTVELDARFQSIRTRETNIGNLVADIMRRSMECDVAMLNSGTLRADALIGPGTYTMRDLVNLLPMQDTAVKLRMTGAQLLLALENSVCKFPALEGRFAQVSGVKFQFDPSKPPGSRIDDSEVEVGGEALDLERQYTVATKAYLALGKDGYDVFKEAEMLIDEENGPVIPIMFRNHLRVLATMNGFAHSDYLAKVYTRKWRKQDYSRQNRYVMCPAVEGRIVAKEMPPAVVDELMESKRIEDFEALHKAGDLFIIHFNDVYNIEPGSREPVGGAARFIAKVRSYSHLKPLILFSGDAFNPSTMSTVTRGAQMPPVLNACGVMCSVLGNHDLDHSVERFLELQAQCDFPWIVSNCHEKSTERPLFGLQDRFVIEHEGHKVGMVGLIEEEWLATLSAVDEEDVNYYDFVEVASRIAKELREDGCDLVIALTHMRQPNDERLAREAEGIDLILGGHDHHYEVLEVNGITICKSGTDFREGTGIKVHFGDGRPTVQHERFEVKFDMPEDDEGRRIVAKWHDEVGAKMDQVIGETEVPLDARFTSIRTRETNIGNFVCDLCREDLGADVYLLNSGTLRADQVIPPGELRLRDLTALLPMADQSVLLSLSGEHILAALENGVSQYPRLEGRFPQVSGVRFEFDPEAEPGRRVVRDSVLIGGEPIDLRKSYKVGTKAYLAKGKDGYTMLPHGTELVDEENGPVLPTTLRNHFRVLAGVNGFLSSTKVPRRGVDLFMKKAGLERSLPATPLTVGEHLKIAPKADGRIVARGVEASDD